MQNTFNPEQGKRFFIVSKILTNPAPMEFLQMWAGYDARYDGVADDPNDYIRYQFEIPQEHNGGMIGCRWTFCQHEIISITPAL